MTKEVIPVNQLYVIHYRGKFLPNICAKLTPVGGSSTNNASVVDKTSSS